MDQEIHLVHIGRASHRSASGTRVGLWRKLFKLGSTTIWPVNTIGPVASRVIGMAARQARARHAATPSGGAKDAYPEAKR